MLEEMRIRGLGVIDDAVLEFATGLTVVTGETGAGKTMVVTGLGLLFGARADPGAVRPGTRAAIVEGRVAVDEGGAAARRAADAGADVDDGALLLSRSVTREGRSRAHVGGRAAPVAVLSELAGDLLAVCGQAESQRLRSPARQRSALDRYAGAAVTEPLADYATAYARQRQIEEELNSLVAQARDRLREADLLRFGLAEVEAVAPQPGEDVELAAEESRLAHADGLRAAATAAHASLLGDPDGALERGSIDAVGLVTAARRSLDAARGHDAELAGLADRVAEVGYLLSDVAVDLASYASGVETDPARLAVVQERRAALTGLARKYAVASPHDDPPGHPAPRPALQEQRGVDDVLRWAERAAGRLRELDSDDERIEALRAERAALLVELGRLAGTVSVQRQRAAAALADAVTGELSSLAMPHARLEVAVRQQDADTVRGQDDGQDEPAGLTVGERRLAYGPHGVDEVELLLAPHPGALPRPLGRGASGGELSRVLLAVEVVMAGADPVPTFVFDEVDAGVGGQAAAEVGRRLARLARTAQVLVVTHLPQVAAYADRHLLVVKSDDGSVTRSGVALLDESARVRELARMLAGREDSAPARAHAEELLAAGRAERDQRADTGRDQRADTGRDQRADTRRERRLGVAS